MDGDVRIRVCLKIFSGALIHKQRILLWTFLVVHSCAYANSADAWKAEAGPPQSVAEFWLWFCILYRAAVGQPVGEPY